MSTAATSTKVSLLLQAKDETEGAFESFKGRLENLKGILETAFIWRAGEMLFEAAIDGVKEFANGLITANADVETLQTSLSALYGSATEAGQAIEYMDSFSLKAPFSKDDIHAAGQEVISFGQDITDVLPAVGNVAAVMGDALPAAVDALEKAIQTGSFRGLTSQLHVTKAELEQFGLVVSATGKVDMSTLLGAFERLSAAKFAGGMAAQMDTFAGATQNLKNQFDTLEEIAGKPLFQELEVGLKDLVSLFQTNQGTVTAFGAGLGAALGIAARAIGDAFGFIGAVAGAFGTWFEGTLLPILETGIGLIAQWWQENGVSVVTNLQTIWGKIQDFGGLVVSGLGAVWDFAKKDMKFFWDEVSGVFTLGKDVITGNWSDFGKTLVDTSRKMAGDVIQLFADLIIDIVDLVTRIAFSVAEAMVPVANAFMGPMTWVAQHFRSLFKDLGGIIGDFVGVMAKAGTDMGNLLLTPINDAIKSIAGAGQFLSKIPGMSHIVGGLANWKPLTLGSGTDNADAAKKTITDWFDSHAPGLDKGQTYGGKNTVADAQAAMEAERTKLVAPFDTFIDSFAAKLQKIVDPSSTADAKKLADATKLGKSIFDGLFGPGGTFGGVKGDITDAVTPKLPNTNFAGADAGAPVIPSTTATGGTAPAPTGRVALGNLGAQFMSALESGGRLAAGTDPATRAAQQQAAGQQTQITQGDKHTTLLETQNALLTDVKQAMQDTRAFLARLAGPHTTPMNPLVIGGVGRPNL